MISRLRAVCITLTGVAALAATPNARAESQQRAVRVVIMRGAESDASRELLDGFRQRLGTVGRAADIVEIPSDKQALERTLGSPVDLIVALGSQATELALASRRGVPVVSTMVTRESSSAVNNPPAFVVLEFLPEVELEWMHRILPKVRRVGVMYSSDDNARLVARARDIARAHGMEIIARRISDPREIPAALASLTGSADVVWGIADDIVLTPETAKAVLLATLRNHVPFVGLSTPWVRAGAVYALERDYTDVGAQVADVVVQIVNGASVQSIGTVRPRRVRFALNMRSADLMNLRFTADVMRSAAEIVQ